MKRSFNSILLATSLALVVLFISQSLWIRYASEQDKNERNASFQSCFNQSISLYVNNLTGKDNAETLYEIEQVNDHNFEEIKKQGNPIEIDAGSSAGGENVSIMIENALIALFINNKSFHLSRLDTLLTTCLNDKGNVVSSHITLQDIRENSVLDEINQSYNSANSSFFVKSYTAERKVEIPSNSYLIKAEYRITQAGYLQRQGILTIVSIVASAIIISVLFYLLIILRRRYAKIANMERSFHGAIHDLKSPLAFVFFSLSALEDEEKDMTKKASLSLMADRVTYLTDKITRMLQSGRNIQNIDEVDKQTVFLYDILEQIETEMRMMFPTKKISFENQLDAEVSLHVSPDLFEASIRIIIENAIKYNNDKPNIQISAIRNINNIEISISDNGVGMSKQQLKHIFEPYYTSDKKQGTGIGLFYAKSIIKAHGGNISVKSASGKGSTFLITIPNS